MTNHQTNTNSMPEGYLEKNQQQNFTQKSEKKNFFQTKRFKTILASMLIILSFGIIGVTALETVGPEEYRISNAFGLNSGTQDEDNNENEINSFEECVEAEGVILESFPEQCSINGQTFTRELTDEEKAMLEEQNNQTSAQPLVADDNYDVVVIEECDLAVAIPKRYHPVYQTKITPNEFIPYPLFADQGQNDKALKGFSIESQEEFPGEYYVRSVKCIEGEIKALPNTTNPTTTEMFNESGSVSRTELRESNIDVREFADSNMFYITRDVPCCGVDNRGSRSYFFYSQGNTVLVNDFFPLYQSAEEYNLILQQNSVAPSTPSIDLNGSDVVPGEGSTQEAALNSYTNQYYPNLNIRYDDSWTFETSTAKSSTLANLLERQIILKKGDSILTISMYPLHVPSGCGGYQDGTYEIANIADKMVRIHDTFQNRYVYNYENPDPSCALSNISNTDIKLSDVRPTSDYASFFEEFKKVHNQVSNDGTTVYNYYITLETTNESYIAEADQIIRQSSF
jgi:hypothetical protein